MHGRFPLKISSIAKYLKNIKIGFLVLLRSIKLRYPFRFIKYQLINLLNYTFIYPAVRLILGNKKALTICNFFETTFCSSGILSLPSPFRSKIIIPKHISYYMLYLETYLADVYYMEMLSEGMNIIDIGAYIGTYTVLAAEKVGNTGKVIAIEPEPKNYKQLIENINLNGFKNVIPKNIALTDHEGLEKLYLSFSSGGYSLVFQEDKNSYIEVPVKTLDRLLGELNLKKVDIIKIDAEGAEIPILKGAEETLEANPNVKIFVASYHYPSEVKEVCKFLNERGFKVKISQNGIVMNI